VAQSGGAPAAHEHVRLARLHCPAGAITCVSFASVAAVAQTDIPVTFGQAFAPGDVATGSTVVARDEEARPLPLQLDQPARHADGSLRFAVLTSVLPHLAPGESRVVGLFRATASDNLATSSPLAPDELPSGFDFRVDLDLYAAQVTQVTLGNRQGATPGTPFAVGETVTLALGTDASERFSITIDAKTAGGGFESLTRLAEAFTALIDRSTRFSAFRIGSNSWENFWITTREAPGRPFTVRVEYAGEARIAAHEVQAYEPRRHFSASTQAAIHRAQLAAPLKTWLNGSLATELSVAMPLVSDPGDEPHRHLEARFNLRHYRGSGRVRTDLVIENDWAYEPGPRTWTYDVTVTQNGTRALAAADVPHYHHARWHKIFWSSDEPRITIKRDIDYLIDSKAIYNYDRSLVLDGATLAKAAASVEKLDMRPMAGGTLQKLMPTAGARDDIGPLPRWTVLYLLSMDSHLEALTFANADAGASVPIHYRDQRTGLPVSLDDHPGINLEYGDAIPPADSVPRVTNGLNPWAPDGAHEPSLAYVPYLISGDEFYLEELQFWATWNLGRLNPAYRGAGRGLLNTTELRDQAWSLRTLAQAAYITPDAHPLKGYFGKRLTDNLAFDIAQYVGSADQKGLGWLEEPYNHGMVSPWQNDYMVTVLGGIADMGFPAAGTLMRWMAGFAAGRWTHEGDGYCWAMAPAYWIRVRAQDDRPFDNFADVFHANWPDVKACPTALLPGSYPDTPFGYAAVARGSLAVLTGFAIAEAKQAWERLAQATPAVTLGFASDPTWAILPRTRRTEP
jgi:hypothetical protein